MLWWLVAPPAWAQTPSADLPRLTAEGREVAWRELHGGVVVLDFFAPYCLPCSGVSRELQESVGRYYEARGGNAHGLPVRVLAVNIDESAPEDVERFRRLAGLSVVYQDAGGALFDRYGGRSVPLIVVLDATGEDDSGPGRLAGRWEGEPGVKAIRGVIDRLGAPGGAGSEVEDRRGRWWGTHSDGRVEASGEALLSSDFRLYQAGMSWFENRGAWDVRLQTTWNVYDLAYEPAPSDLISQPTELDDDEPAFQGRVRARFAEGWQAELSGGWYTGFADYRSLWLDEYYRQYFGKVRGYEEADPGGWNLGPGVRWECIPGTAWLQAGLVVQQDEVSPGYEKAPFQPLIRGTSELHTLAGTIGFEQVLSGRWRVQHSVRFTDTTDRDLRYEYLLSLRWSVAASWGVRATGGATMEPPDFYAYQGQVAVERDWRNRWFLGVFARYYTDNGLVRDPKIVSNASPPLDTWQLGLTGRYQTERWGAQISAGPYWTLYDAVPFISRHFSTLYADRDWVWVQAAVNLRF